MIKLKLISIDCKSKENLLIYKLDEVAAGIVEVSSERTRKRKSLNSLRLG